MYTFIKSSYIKCDIEQLFEFHQDINNLKYITPPDMKVEILNQSVNFEQFSVIKIKAAKFFIPTIWEVKINKIDKPYLLVDVALKSPFKSWIHKHIFIKHKNYCELKDVVEYELPFGFLNTIANIFMKKNLQNMFNYRHINSKKILEKE